jgi:hypothetical protein
MFVTLAIVSTVYSSQWKPGGYKDSERKPNSVASVRQRTIPTERWPLLGQVMPTSADRGCQVVNVTDPYGHILGLLDRSRYVFFQVALKSYSRG